MNNTLVITSDSGSDLPQDFIQEKKIDIITMGFVLEDVTYKGEEITELDLHDFYNKIRNGAMPKTVQTTPDDAAIVFEKHLKEGKDIIHITLSSGLSGSYGSVCIAMNELKEKYPDRKIAVIDSLCASLGEGLLVYKAVEMMENGDDFDKIVKYLEDNKKRIIHFFTVDDLFHLQRGGRLSKTTAILGSMLGVKPVLTINDEGKLIPMGKVRGRNQSLVALVDNMAKKYSKENENETVYIAHADCIEDAEFIKKLIISRFGIKNVLIGYVGPVIGSHAGPGTAAVLFWSSSTR